MGLLDDAIRDHLELKRLRGADPGEVAREQKEALTPVLGDDAEPAEDEPVLELEDFNLATDLPSPPSLCMAARRPLSSTCGPCWARGRMRHPSSLCLRARISPRHMRSHRPSGLTMTRSGWERPQGSSSATPADPDTTTIRRRRPTEGLGEEQKHQTPAILALNSSSRGHSSAGRAPALQAGGHRFDPGCSIKSPLQIGVF